MTARKEILARIDSALKDRPRVGPIPRAYHRRIEQSVADRIALFSERVRDYGATVRHCAQAEVGLTIGAVLAERGASRVVVPEGIPRDWLPRAVQDSNSLSAAELDRLDGVLTTCALAIAQTGTIVLDHSSGQGRRALTLIPDMHIVVVRTDQILASVPEAVAALDGRRTMTWISGPSATSDIELQRVEGVHGPRALNVVIVDTR